MARNTFEAWIPEEDDSAVIQRVRQLSGVEAFGKRVPMNTDVRNHPRSAGVGVAEVSKGDSYTEDTSSNDAVTLTAVKIGKAIRIAEEDLEDSLVDVINAKQMDWTTSYSKYLDNAALAVTAASSPFAASVYLSASGVGNLTQTGTGGITYDNLSSTLGALEDGDYFDLSTTVAFAHPSVRQALRGIKDDQSQPIFVQGTGGTPDTIFGIQVHWTNGAKTSATATDSPSGNPLVAFVNSDFLLVGVRSGPESVFIDGRDGASALTDEAILKMRARRAFALGIGNAASVLEDNS